ncbi:MAG: hypothetical protein ABJC89_12970 [Acidobacteriota bacterium]
MNLFGDVRRLALCLTEVHRLLAVRAFRHFILPDALLKPSLTLHDRRRWDHSSTSFGPANDRSQRRRIVALARRRLQVFSESAILGRRLFPHTAGKLLFAGDGSGNIAAFDPANGTPSWHSRIGNVSGAGAPQTDLLDGSNSC